MIISKLWRWELHPTQKREKGDWKEEKRRRKIMRAPLEEHNPYDKIFKKTSFYNFLQLCLGSKIVFFAHLLDRWSWQCLHTSITSLLSSQRAFQWRLFWTRYASRPAHFLFVWECTFQIEHKLLTLWCRYWGTLLSKSRKVYICSLARSSKTGDWHNHKVVWSIAGSKFISCTLRFV